MPDIPANVRITSLDERPRRCRRCGRAILWATTLAGKKMPVELSAAVHYRGAPNEDAERLYWPLPAGKTHFSHCVARARSADSKEARFRGEQG